MKRTAWATLGMTISFLLGTIIALGSLISLEGQLNTDDLTASPLGTPTLLVSCLEPLAITLEIAAIILIWMDRKPAGERHQRLVLAALVCFLAWGLLNVGGFIPLSIAGMQNGSLALVKAGQMVKAAAATLQYAVPFLLVYGLSSRNLRGLLWLALVLTVAGNLSLISLPISTITLQAGAGRLHTIQLSVDYTQRVYPFLLGMGYLGGVLYMMAYGITAFQLIKSITPDITE